MVYCTESQNVKVTEKTPKKIHLIAIREWPKINPPPLTPTPPLKKRKEKIGTKKEILDKIWRTKNAPKLSSKYLVHGIRTKLLSNYEQNMLYNRNQQILCLRNMCSLKGLNVWSLGCKCACYRSGHNGKGEGPHGTEFWRSWKAKMKHANG